MAHRFADTVVLVTGGGSGSGAATVHRFAEVAAVIASLAGPDAAFVTGVVLAVDGGLSASDGQPRMSG